MLDISTVESSLTSTVFTGKLHHFSSIGSTNTYAMQQARLGAPHGSVYVADEQTAGRGRNDHQWLSAAGQGLYVSVIVRPRIATSQIIWLPLLAGLALHRAVFAATGLNADLRWPNDLLIGERKVAGILVEAQTDAALESVAVIGTGVNLHQKQFSAQLATPATSLDLETGRFVSREDMLIALLESLDHEMAPLANDKQRDLALAAIPSRMEAISSWIRGKFVEVHGPQMLRGNTAGLSSEGFLLVETERGQVTVTTGGLRKATT
uniref:Biotin--acetyl-CoA-carboxylase ligase n=1 Tax=mine drainage metagenome TaxID=410659 RepID=E6PYR4_9ZZZZ